MPMKPMNEWERQVDEREALHAVARHAKQLIEDLSQALAKLGTVETASQMRDRMKRTNEGTSK